MVSIQGIRGVWTRSCIRFARSASNTSQIVRSLNSGCLAPFGVGDALVFQPGIQFGQARSPAAWGGTAGRADCRPGSRPGLSPEACFRSQVWEVRCCEEFAKLQKVTL